MTVEAFLKHTGIYFHGGRILMRERIPLPQMTKNVDPPGVDLKNGINFQTNIADFAGINFREFGPIRENYFPAKIHVSENIFHEN